MTGDAPQPGETPHNEGGPWSYADPPGAHLRPRSAPGGDPALETPEAVAPELAEAHLAGVQDVAAALNVLAAPTRPETEREELPEPEPAVDPDAKGVEQHHEDVDAERFNTGGDSTAYAALDPEPAAGEAPDVMILPEPDRDRPTVALERGAVPGQPPSGLPRFGRGREDGARADRALQDRVRQERTTALLETSPFWRAGEEGPAAGLPALDDPGRPAGAARRSRRGPRNPRRPATGLLGLLALGLVAAFFAWVSAEPLWLAAGHGDRGSATVLRCTGSGVTQRCTGQFTAAGGAYRVDDLTLLGVEPDRRATGSIAPARMVSGDSRQAYVGSTGMLVHLRWALGLVLLLVCGLGIAGLTGARRLDTARARHGALLISIAGPLVLLAGFLAAAY
ncbi:hypothetical protein ACFQFC_26945 [Amorphoplanes digitatis]|uniref:Uncharacterized protein n=1 Tax=Actinoplanes digitatis TaxID=1868 RepID=A0A7W7HS49_9ACTN|nr:hypothetical protein [Actinoplanes digitatis]MBB4759781.1 hypothetical protein [Actinoplanes digitatis]GID94387.1 hypothetical protein Adi01nite_37990 [Actinoplanes digitatis]